MSDAIMEPGGLLDLMLYGLGTIIGLGFMVGVLIWRSYILSRPCPCCGVRQCPRCGVRR